VTHEELVRLALGLGADRVPGWCRANGVALPAGWPTIRERLLHGDEAKCTALRILDVAVVDPHPAAVVPLLTYDEVAEHLRVSARTVAGLVQRGELVPTRIGRSVRFSRAALDEYLRAAESDPSLPIDAAPDCRASDQHLLEDLRVSGVKAHESPDGRQS
jgi:excisionase family DNA binding protein